MIADHPAPAEPEVARRGFYGKLPARGDFVRNGLTASFVAAWDEWAEVVLTGSRRIMGEAWTPAWLEAPVWRFALPHGLLGPETAAGLFMPSVDRVGRYFPLCFACLARAEAASVAAERAAGWLALAEEAGRAALALDLPPKEMAARVFPEAGVAEQRLVSCPRSSPHFAADGGDQQATENKELVSRSGRFPMVTNFGSGTLALPWLDAPAGGGLWWTAGSPRVPPAAFTLPILPDAERFAAMLDARFAEARSGAAG